MRSTRQSKKATTKQVGIRLPATLNDRLVAIARSESNNVSAVVRRLLTAGLARELESAESAR